MVERLRRRRGMYDITRIRMLLTTGVFAAVAALFAAGANARIPADTGSAFAAQESLGIGRYAVLPSAPNVAQLSGTNGRIPADTSSAFAAQESLRIGRYLVQPVKTRFEGQSAGTQSRAGSTRYGYVVGGELILPQQSSVQLSSGFDAVADAGGADNRFTAHVGMMNQLRNLTEQNAIKWGWSQGLTNDQASTGLTRYSGS
jgi:hypothetical protein